MFNYWKPPLKCKGQSFISYLQPSTLTYVYLLHIFISFLPFSFNTFKPKSKLCYDRRSVGQSVLVSSTFLLLSNSCGFVDVRRPLWWEDGSVVYNCCWSSPAQSFSGPSPAGLITTFYCLTFEIPPTWRARSLYLYAPGTEWPSYTPRHWVPFSSPPTTGRATVVVFEPASPRRTFYKPEVHLNI
jgi:hypothetical protein